MQQNYTDIGDYFAQLATSHRDINAFCRAELDELLCSTVNLTGFPALVLEGFDFDYSGSTPDNVLKSRNGAICVIDKCNVTDADQRTAVMERTEKIAEQVLMKMLADKRNRVPLLTGFEIASAEGTHAVNPVMGFVFCRVSFSFKTKITGVSPETYNNIYD